MPTINSTSHGQRHALLVATSNYSDPGLSKLRAPGRDASELTVLLRDPQIGSFDVQTLIDTQSAPMQEGIEEFCADRHPNDQLLIYLSCHGVLDDSGRLYYAATNTRRQRLAATAVAATWLTERLEDCRARRQIVILDCCHSGAFARGAHKGDAELALALQERFEPRGRGRVVLTASRSTEYSFEGDRPSGDGVRSVFTEAIINGLRTGDADRDKDGLITVTDLYQYVFDNVRRLEPRQTPELWLYAGQGSLLVARSIRGPVIEPVSLPEDLRVTLDSPRPMVRETGVAELAGLLDTAESGLALSARQALRRIADRDSPRVAAVARAALAASRGTAVENARREITERNRVEEQEQARRAAQERARRRLEESARGEDESLKARAVAADLRRLPSGDEPSGEALKGWRSRWGRPLVIGCLALSILALGGIRLTSAEQNHLAYQHAQQLAALSSNIIVLAQRLDNEMEQAVTYISVGRPAGDSSLAKQYDTTSQLVLSVSNQLRQIGGSFPEQTQTEATLALATLQTLPALRHAVSSSLITVVPVVQKYAQVIDDLQSLEDQTVQGSGDATLSQLVGVLGLVSAMREDTSEQRAILDAALTDGQLTPDLLNALYVPLEDQQGVLQIFDASATAAQQKTWDDAMSSPAVDDASSGEQLAISTARYSNKSLASDYLKARYSDKEMSGEINSQESIEKNLASQVSSRIGSLQARLTALTLISGALLLALSLLFMIVFGRSIISFLRRRRRLVPAILDADSRPGRRRYGGFRRARPGKRDLQQH
jgi:hypothetical protein